MSLDFSILEADGLPGSDFVRLRVDDHHRLLSACLLHSFPSLSKVHDYYEDAVFDPHEVPLVIAELSTVREKFRQDSEMLKAIDNLLGLFESALQLNSGVIAVAD